MPSGCVTLYETCRVCKSHRCGKWEKVFAQALGRHWWIILWYWKCRRSLTFIFIIWYGHRYSLKIMISFQEDVGPQVIDGNHQVTALFHRVNVKLSLRWDNCGISLPPIFCIPYIIIIRYYPGELINIPVQSCINIFQENNWAITTKIG